MTDTYTTIVPVILSGGSGSRLWPQSREQYPKQLLALTSERTLIQETAARAGADDGFAAPIIVCNEEQRFIIAEQMRRIGVQPAAIIVEPVARNTAPAIAAAALAMANPDALMLVMPADHLITDKAAFHASVKLGAAAAHAGKLVTFGMNPAFPETGYGYIKRGEAEAQPGVFGVSAFVEKPSRETAESYLALGAYVWNSGIFLFSATTFLAELQAHAPAIRSAAEKAVAGAQRDLDFLRLDKAAFAAAPSTSIDYAVMEHTKQAAVVPAAMGWTDIGSWAALWDVAAKDERGNAWLGDAMLEDCDTCYVDSVGRLAAVVGCRDTIVVTTPDAVLVAARDRAQDVKKIVERLKAGGRGEATAHRKAYRPWGSYDFIQREDHFEVRHIRVAPGGVVGLQTHARRAEHWVVVAGTATVTLGDRTLQVGANQSVYVPAGSPHRLENRGAETLDLIEVQSGEYLGEDDIERLETRY